MLRFLYTVCDWLGTFFAILSPIVIIDWLGKATNIKLMEPIHASLAPLVEPLSATVDMFAHLPTMHFDGQNVSITQGVVGILFTGCFFLCSMTAQLTRAADQRISVTKEVMSQHVRMQQIKAQEAQAKKKSMTHHELVVFVACNTETFPQTGTIFETGVSRYGGKAQQTTPESMLIAFPNAVNGVRFALESGQAVLKAYQQLRPLDPQPPFKIGLHAAHDNDQASTRVAMCNQLVQYAANNQAVFTQQAKDFLEAQGQMDQFKYHPIGAYSFAGAGSQDIYKLVL